MPLPTAICQAPPPPPAPARISAALALTLSYLLYDFGARSANLESARQLLAAASATQDSTVQAVFLVAVQAYYQAQATNAALDAAIESERAAKESFAAAEARYKAGSATPADKLQAQTAYSLSHAESHHCRWQPEKCPRYAGKHDRPGRQPERNFNASQYNGDTQ